MPTTFNITQALADPVAIQASPDITPAKVKRITKSVPEQSWAMAQTLLFIQTQTAGLRDPQTLAQTIAASLAPAINMSDSNADMLTTLYSDSNTRRAAVDLDPIAETTYKSERNPNYLQTFIVNLLNASGIESELQDDLTYSTGALPEVEVTDSNVRPAWQTGTSTPSTEETAQAIAESLGLEVQHSSEEQINLIIPAQMSVDSTDPYTKKVMGP